ncbi:MAG: hypothetical protein QOK28_22 [Actinomycetota bacterium]
MTAVAHFPASFDKGFLERLRRPLSALAATILVIDLMGLGMHLADSAESPFANDAPTRAKVRVGGPEAVVPNTTVAGAGADRRADRTVQPLGCLAISSGCYAGPPASSTPPSGSNTATPQGNGGGTTTPANAAKPLAQADVAVPALGAQVSLGVGDGGCTGLDLTLLAVGGCPAATGDGPVIVKLGGSLVGD